MKLHAVNNAGVEFQLLTPFFESLLPAFEAGAGEIRVQLAGSGLKLTYDDKDFSVPLPSSPYNYGVVAFSRILILSEMSLALEGTEQKGSFRVRYNQQLISIDVISRRDSEGWDMIFRPNPY